MATKEEVKKSAEEIVAELQSEEIEKSVNCEDSNGGKDEYKSGTPKTEMKGDPKKKDKEMKKSDEEDSEEDSEDKVEKSEESKEEEKVEKSEEASETKEEEVIEKSEEKAEEAMIAQDEEERELLKAWRAQKEQSVEEITKSQEEPAKEEVIEKSEKEDKSEELAKSLREENETLKKSLADQTDMIKSLTEKVEKLANQPAYDKRSVDSLETIEKSEPKTPSIKKSDVLDALLQLQQEGIATSHDVTKYESTNVLSKSLQESVKEQLTKKN